MKVNLLTSRCHTNDLFVGAIGFLAQGGSGPFYDERMAEYAANPSLYVSEKADFDGNKSLGFP